MYSVPGRGSFVTEESEFVVSRNLRRISQEGKYCKHPCLLIRGEIPSVNCHSSPFIILNLAGGWLVISDEGAIRWHQPSAASITQIRHLDWVIDCKWKFMFQWFISKGCWEDWLMISRFLGTDSRPFVQALFSFHQVLINQELTGGRSSKFDGFYLKWWKIE